MTRTVTVWDPDRVAADLTSVLPAEYALEHVVGRPLREIPAHVAQRRPDVLHVVTEDDGSELALSPDLEETPEWAEWAGPSPDIAILDGCYRPELAERLRSSGCVVIGLPGRLGRGNADEFLRVWYARSADTAVDQAFDAALSGDLAQLPDLVRPRLHHVERKGSVVFRGPDTTLPQTVTVWYGTNRTPDTETLYNGQPNDELHTGRVEIWVPAGVAVGRSRTPRRRGATGPNTYLPRNHQRLDQDGFRAGLRAALEQHPIGRRSVLVYLHGYRTTFVEAANRAAQLHVDLNHPGQTAFFSWPSRGTPTGYFADEDAVQHTERHLLRFLTELCRQVDADEVNVLAHSMGNRALLRVAMQIAQQTGRNAPRFGHILLAAADVGRHFFQTEATAYATIARSVTSYVSAGDKALKSSGILHRGDRAGLTPPYTVVSGIDTIDASDIDLTYLGHGYYAAARPVLGDMHTVLHGRHRPDERFGLRRVEQDAQTLWRFRS